MKSSLDPCGRILLFVVLRQAVRRGVALGDALRSTAGETGVPAATLAAMADEIDDGHPLSETIERRPEHFPAPLAALVAAGERSARLDETLDRCAELLRRTARARAHLGAGLVYPALCLGMLAATTTLHAVFDPVGRFAELGHVISGASSGRVFLSPVERYNELGGAIQEASSAGFRHWMQPALVVGLIAAAILAAALYAAPDWRDRIRLYLPVTGRLSRLAAAASFTRALAALLERGAPVDYAVEAALPCAGNRFIESRLRLRLEAVRDGATLARNLALSGVFPPSLTWRLAAGEARGAFVDALATAAAAYDDELEVRSARVARLVEPAGVILVGLIAVLVLRLVVPASALGVPYW